MTKRRALVLCLTIAITGCGADAGQPSDGASGGASSADQASQVSAQSSACTSYVNFVAGPGAFVGNAGTADFYWSAANGGGSTVYVNRSVNLQKNGAWEQFCLIARGNGNWAIQTNNGHYLSARGGGGGVVAADRTAIGAWETFHVANSNTPNWTFQTANGHYLSAQGNGCEANCVLNANASSPSTWEDTIVTAVVDHPVLKEFFNQGWQMLSGFQVFGPTVSSGSGWKYHELTLQPDGNLVLYRHDVAYNGSENLTATWSPPGNECLHKGVYLRLGEAGAGNGGFDLAVMKSDGTSCFSVSKSSGGNVTLDVQGDGNLVIYSDGYPQWSTGTGGK